MGAAAPSQVPYRGRAAAATLPELALASLPCQPRPPPPARTPTGFTCHTHTEVAQHALCEPLPATVGPSVFMRGI